MKKYDVLKVVIILQAIGMFALASFAIWQFWPNFQSRSADHDGSMLSEEDRNLFADEVVAVIGEKNITKQQLLDELMELYGDQTLNEMLLHLAIEMAAKDKNITISSSELEEAVNDVASGYESRQQYFDMMKEQLGLSEKRVVADIKDHALLIKIAITDIAVSDEEIISYLENHPEQFQQTQQFRLSWILSENYSDANKVLQELMQGADFAQMASQYSIDSYSATMGGDLGEIERNDPFYDRNMLDEAAKMQVGDIVGPLETEDGYAIVYLAGRKISEPLTKDQQEQKARVEVALQKVGSLLDVQQELMAKYSIGIKK